MKSKRFPNQVHDSPSPPAASWLWMLVSLLILIFPAKAAPCPTVTSTADSGFATLRQCIAYANSNPGTTIVFDMPDTAPGYTTSGSESWWRISPASALPRITANGTIIDGTTQAANYGTDTNSQGPEIEIEGSAMTENLGGLVLAPGSDGSTIQGLVINRFVRPGTDDDGIRILSDNNTIAGNYIGTDPTGTVAQPNGSVGIQLGGGASGNTIGGTAASDRNIVSGKAGVGIALTN